MQNKKMAGVFLALVAIVIAAIYFRGPNDPSTAPRFFGPSELAISPVPGRPGPYHICTRDFSPRQQDINVAGRIFAPVLDTRTCQTTDRKFNLVLILHADGASNNFTNYEELARHLASNAMVVVSVDRHTGSDDGGVTIRRHLDYLYGPLSGVGGLLSDRVALIGHSAGGRAVIENADAVEPAGGDLAAIVVLSPTTSPPAVTFTGISPALLAIHVVGDGDPGAYGAPQPGLPMRSAFKIYDEAGVTGDPNVHSLEKSMVYASDSTHYYQDRDYVLTYVNAFLQLHLNGHNAFRRFFKFQEQPPSLANTTYDNLRIQHEDRDRLALDDFENGDPTSNLYGETDPFGAGLGTLVEGPAFIADEFSPHSTGTLQVALDGETNGPNPRIDFNFGVPRDLSLWRFLGLRAGQVYHPDLNPSGEGQDLRLLLLTEGGSASIRLSDVGPLVRFPSVIPKPPSANNADFPPGVTDLNAGTKNSMASYLIRLTDFEGVDLSAVTGVRVAFQDVEGATIFVFDDLAFYRF